VSSSKQNVAAVLPFGSLALCTAPQQLPAPRSHSCSRFFGRISRRAVGANGQVKDQVISKIPSNSCRQTGHKPVPDPKNRAGLRFISRENRRGSAKELGAFEMMMPFPERQFILCSYMNSPNHKVVWDPHPSSLLPAAIIFW